MKSTPKDIDAVLGQIRGSSKPAEEAGPPPEKVAAAEEILAAVESGDAAALAEAVSTLVRMCSDEYGKE